MLSAFPCIVVLQVFLTQASFIHLPRYLRVQILDCFSGMSGTSAMKNVRLSHRPSLGGSTVRHLIGGAPKQWRYLWYRGNEHGTRLS